MSASLKVQKNLIRFGFCFQYDLIRINPILPTRGQKAPSLPCSIGLLRPRSLTSQGMPSCDCIDSVVARHGGVDGIDVAATLFVFAGTIV